ncbi:phosphotransferase family protein [Kushneria indalinina]|uniref:Aminoglycoside phosphotransferase (APT) family kinase protein n=1 Tax=Kushneria indalinina DSM 14324 TaxID=1122140 RepID=A0A3D9DZE9_9GAMM|nr:phosphotransferase family protein [Kushneria indalinina]REC95699.1 aminoglycoside phosphotransferase (APT) family kinase protein [Kushneria indalinina DSM 14324]
MSDTDTGSDSALCAWLTRQSSAESVVISAQRRLGGGAVQDNLLLDVTVTGGPMAGEQRWVLRSDARASLAISASRAEEFVLLERAWHHGIRVPEPLWMCEDDSVLGRPFMIMRHVGGEASPRALVARAGDNAFEPLVEALGAELARIHALPLPDDALHQHQETDVVARQLFDFQTRLARLEQPQPVLAWALRWLARHPPAPSRTVLAHNDFRTGNLLIDDGQLEAVLDWEFAGLNDAFADIGWFCAPCWRFGGPGEAGGLGSIEAFLRGYENAGGERPDQKQLDGWIILATLRWAVIALEQSARHDSGVQPDLELALTSHLLPGLELDLLRLIPVDDEVDPTRLRHSANDVGVDGDGQALPGAWEALSTLNEEARDLMEITRQTLKSEIIPALEGEARHSALMVANALSIIARQQYQGESIWHQVRETLSHQLSLPMEPEDPHAAARTLVDEIHRGERDDPDRFEALRHLLREDALARARISQPRAAQAEQ